MRGYLRVDIANNCNIRCIMCQAYNGQARADISFFDFDVFARQTRGDLKHWQVIQLGNTAEATIHPKFGDYLKYIRSESDAVIHIVTNGKLLGRYAKLINEVGNCLVHISMDSLKKETHEYIREGSDYNKVMSSLPLLDTARTRVLLSFTLMKSNLAEYPEMVAFCKERGYTMGVFPMILREEFSIIPYNLLEESLWFNFDSLKSWLKEYYGNDYESVVTGSASGTTNLGISEFSCNAHNDDLVIQASGNTMLCFRAEIGSLYQHRLEELWNSPAADRFREKVDLDRSPCFDCNYRKRCLAPSMSQLDNHFSESICAALSEGTRDAIGYDRTISDEEALQLFMRDVGTTKFGIFRIEQSGSRFLARRVTVPADKQTDQVYYESSPLEAASRHELQQLMVATTGSILTPRLIEGYDAYNLVAYLGKFWAFPQALGVLNPTHEEDRRKPGILSSDTLAELKKKCDEAKDYAVPSLIGSQAGYNIVRYLGKYWAAPQSLGPVNFSVEEEQRRPGIISAETQEDLLQLIPSWGSLSSLLVKGDFIDGETVSISRRAKISILLFNSSLKSKVKHLYAIATKSHMH